jgi:hypothetical protein
MAMSYLHHIPATYPVKHHNHLTGGCLGLGADLFFFLEKKNPTFLLEFEPGTSSLYPSRDAHYI